MTLHEAMRLVLSNQPNKTATIDVIANEINLKKLFIRKDKQPLPGYQVMMRAKLSKGRYQHLFEWIETDSVKLKN